MRWRSEASTTEKLYGAIVAQARLPVFYQSFGVPDTLQGRFILLSLNLFAVLRRLKAEGTEAHDLAQKLVDQFSADMETVLREMGVGDLSIPKKVRGLAASSAALLQSYEEGFAAGEGVVAGIIAEALPLEGTLAEAAGGRLAHYLEGVVQHLEKEPLSALSAGEVRFPEMGKS
jgi:cytochrome b pre-mRNA-processing protein 3